MTSATRFVLPMLLVAVVFTVYSSTLRHPFHFDDASKIINNPAIKDPWDIERVFRHNPARFLVFESLAINWSIGGRNTFGYHLFNITVHAITTVVVFWLAGLLFRASGQDESSGLALALGMAAALFFALHPLQTQAVTYIWQRNASMVAMLYLSSIYCYLRFAMKSPPGPISGQGSVWLGLSLAFALAAMATKQLAVTLPLAVVMVDYYFISRSLGALRARAPYLRPYLLLLPVAPVLTLVAEAGELGDVLNAEDKLSPYTYLITQFGVIVLYLRLLVYPVGQNLDHHILVPDSIFHAAPWLILLLILFAAGVALFRINRMASFGILFFFLAISVESSILPLPPEDLAFEHRMYLPMAGLAITMVSLAHMALAGVAQKKALALVIMATVAVGALLSWGTYQRNLVWSSPISLWEDSVSKSPGKSRPYQNLAVALLANREVDRALVAMNTAKQLDPDNIKTLANLGVVLYARGDVAAAAENYLAALKKSPTLPNLAHRLGRAYHDLKRYDEASQFLKMAVRLNPRSIRARMDLGRALADGGQTEEAIMVMEDIIKMAPTNARAHHILAQLLRQNGKIARADEHLAKAKALGYKELPPEN